MRRIQFNSIKRIIGITLTKEEAKEKRMANAKEIRWVKGLDRNLKQQTDIIRVSFADVFSH